MSRLFDLSHPIQDQMPAFPGDDSCRLIQTKSVETDGYVSFLLNTGLHVGTHLDAPLHFLAEGAMVKDLPLNIFTGRGTLIDVRGEGEIYYKTDYESRVQAGDIVLLWTNHSTKFGTGEYYEQHPIVQEDFADFLVGRGIRMLGMDFPSPDRPPFSIHKQLLGAGIPLIENLTNVGALAEIQSFEIMAFPLKISAEGCPVRVVAKTT